VAERTSYQRSRMAASGCAAGIVYGIWRGMGISETADDFGHVWHRQTDNEGGTASDERDA